MAAFEMFSISLSVDGTIKLVNSLQRIDTTHTICEAIEECLAQNHILGQFEINPHHMKVYVSKSINSARVFVKPEDPMKLNEPTFAVNRETIEATFVFSQISSQSIVH